MEEPLDPSTVVGLLAEPERLRVFAAVTLGTSRLDAIVDVAGVSLPTASKALERLVGGGLVLVDGGGYRAAEGRLKATARAHAPTRSGKVPGAEGMSEDQVGVLRTFVVNGRLQSVPVARAKRLVVLDWLAGRFEPGTTYPERDVNFMLGLVHADYAALRRYLVDEGLLERRDGFYWRAGGTFELEDDRGVDPT